MRPLFPYLFSVFLIVHVPNAWGAIKDVKELLNGRSVVDVDGGEFPWIVGLLDVTLGDDVRKLVCGGSILSPSHVITSGRCVTQWVEVNHTHSVLPPHSLRVLAGDISRMEDEESEQIRPVQEILLHPDFHYDSGYKGHKLEGHKGFKNDMAVLVVEPPFNFSQYGVHAIPLVEEDWLDGLTGNEQLEIVIAGWGITDKRQQTIPTGITLKKVALPFNPKIRNNTGKQMDFGLWREGHLVQFSSGIGNNNGLMGKCMGDPGGAVLIKSDQGWVQVGVISFGVWCDRYLPSGQLLLFTPQQWEWLDDVLHPKFYMFLSIALVMLGVIAALVSVWVRKRRSFI